MDFGKAFAVASFGLGALVGADAEITAYTSLAAFQAAAGSVPIAADFDAMIPGTVMNGWTIAGATFKAVNAPLIVVRGSDTYTPPGFNGAPNPLMNVLVPTSGANVLSPGGPVLGPGPNPAIEDDDIRIEFQHPIKAFGFDHLSQSCDGFSYTTLKAFNSSGGQVFAAAVPIRNLGAGGPGGADFYGIVSTSSNITSVLIDEGDSDSQYPDCNIGIDTLRYDVPGLRFSGTVGLGAWIGSVAGVPVLISIYSPGGKTPIETHWTTLDDTGEFWVSTDLTGVYDIAAKASHWLRQRVNGVGINQPGLSFWLTNGDVDGDNVISVFDYNVLSDAFDSSPGDPNWNPEADLDGDGSVTVYDYNILSVGFDRIGD